MLLVGLGNPGEKYRFTRHNVGFMAVDAFAKRHAFPDFKLDKKSPVLLSEDFIEHQKVVLAKPQAFMNNSGKAVADLCQRYRVRDLIIGVSEKTEIQGRHSQDQSGLLSILKPFSIRHQTPGLKYMVVVHDDIDIPFGHMKISVGSGSAGHKGIESIIEKLGTKDFGRIRIGIQPEDGKPERVEEFVLQQFSQAERATLEQTMGNACSALDSILQDGIEKAMSEYNK
ncbi:MAG TPA: aminoacyl-tRNA hydrolase [Candidatus Paceibacterota bacterium]